MRVAAAAFGLFVLVGCHGEPRVPEAPGAPEDVTYALAHPHELARLETEYDKGKTSALQRCSEAVELVETVKEPIDADLWVAVLEAAERSGKSRLFAARLRENSSFDHIFHEDDDDIPKRTLGATKYVADQKGCAGTSDIAGAAVAGLKRAAEKRLEERLRDVNEGHLLLKTRREPGAKPTPPPILRQADAVAVASYLVSYELPRVAHERMRLAGETPLVRRTLEAAIEHEKAAQGVVGANDAEKKAAGERLRELEASLVVLDEVTKKLGPTPEVRDEATLHDVRDGCHDILDAARAAIRKRAAK